MSLSREDRFANVEQFWQAFCDAADEKQASSAEIADLSTGALPDIQLRPIEDITTIFTHKKDDIPVVKRGKTPRILLALFVLAVIASSVLYFFVSPRLTASHPKVALTAVVRPTHSASPTAFPTLSLYPQLAANYHGASGTLKPATPGTTVVSPTLPLYLLNIHEAGNTIRGNFRGLGQNTPFNGIIKRDSTVDFRVSFYDGQTTVDFNGTIHMDSSIGGHYTVYFHSQKTGEEGEWSVSPIG